MSRTYKTGLLITGDARGGVRAVQLTQKELGKLGAAGKKVGDQLKHVGEGLTSVGRTMTTRVTVPIAAAGVGILKSAGDFEAAMNRVAAVSGASGDEFDALNEQAKELGRTTKFSASEAADAMGFLAMAGNDASQILSAMPATLQLAAAAGVDLGSAADTVTNILSGFRLETEELTRANDVLISAMTGSNTDLQQLGEALKYVGPVAAGFGLTLEGTTAALGLLGNAGIQASMAGTTLRGMLTRLADPSKEAAGILNDLGIAAFNADGSMKPLADILGQIETSGMSSAEAMSVFGQRAGPGVLALVGQGTGSLIDLQDRLKSAGGTAERIANVQMQGLNGAMKSFTSAMEGLGLAIAGSGLLEFATGIVTTMTEWVRTLAETNPEILNLGVVVAGAAAAIGPLALILGGVVTALGALISPIGLVVVAVGGLAAAWLLFKDDIVAAVDVSVAKVKAFVIAARDMATQAVKFVTDMVRKIKEQLVGQFSRIGDAVGDTVDSVVGFFRDMYDKVVGRSYVPDLVEGIEDEFGRLDDVMVDPSEDATSAVSGFFEDLGERVGSIIKGLIRGTTNLKDALRSLAEDTVSRFIDRGIDSVVDRMFGGTGGGSLVSGTVRSGGGGSGGGGLGMNGLGTVARTILGNSGAIGSALGSMGTGGAMLAGKMFGASSWAGANAAFAAGNVSAGIPGLTWASTGAASGATTGAAAAAGAKAGAAAGTQAASSAMAGAGGAGGAGAMAAGGVVLAGIGYLGASAMRKKRNKRIRRQNEFFTQVGTGTSEDLGEGMWDYRGSLNDAEAFFSTTRAGWQSTIAALHEAGVLTKGWGAQLDENGNGLVKMQGDIEGIKRGLSGAAVTGFNFSTSLDKAMEKGEMMSTQIVGDADAIKAALNAATAMGIGGFTGLRETATGVSVQLTGDIARWQQYLQSFVNEAIRSAISGVGALGNEAGSATQRFLELASAAAKVRAVGGGIHTPDGSHAGGLSYVPFDGYQAVLHQGERVLTRQENLRYAPPTQPVDWAPLLAEVRELKRAVFASSSSVRQGVDETTREVKRQTRGYTRRVA